MRKWPGRGVSGLESKHASFCAKILVNSSKFSQTSSTTLLKCCLNLLTAASHRPLKCGACSGVKCQLMFCSEQKSEIDSCSFALLRNEYNLSNYFAAPTKLAPSLLHITMAYLILATNCRSVAINAAIGATSVRITYGLKMKVEF